jgi:hypothetical protein
MAPRIPFTGISKMAKGLTSSSLAAALTLAGLAGASGKVIPNTPRSSAASGGGQAGNQTGSQIGTTRPPSAAEIAARAKVLLEHQHANDEALEQYERVEHHVDRTGGATPRVLDDKTYRVVPTGSGTMSPTIPGPNPRTRNGRNGRTTARICWTRPGRPS